MRGGGGGMFLPHSHWLLPSALVQKQLSKCVLLQCDSVIREVSSFSLLNTHTHLSICWRIWSIFLSFSADFCCFPADDCVQNHSNLLASGLKALISHVCSKYLFFFRVKNTTSVVLMVENRTTFQMYPHWPQEALKGEIKTTSRTSKTSQRTTTTSQRTSDHLRSQSSTVTLQHHTHTAGRLH